MPLRKFRHAFVAVLVVLSMMLAQGTWALAGTTGGISGTLTDRTTGKTVADAKITVISPSQTASTTTDAGGRFTFLNLAPDSYTVTAEKTNFTPVSISGVTVFADQNITVSLQTQPQLKTIAQVTSRSAGNLVKPGTTSDVYSVNAATQQTLASSGGGFNLNSAYSALYAQPGVTSYVGNYGWGQVFYIRGGSYSQTGYEFDGVPVNRAFDNYQANSLSNLGQQELQVYTGGSPAGASSATLGGFINQVIKTGTYPGFGTAKIGLGNPGFYHALTGEAGGASPNRLFSYYVASMGFNQHYPYGTFNNFGGIDYTGHSSYGLTAPSETATLFGPLIGAYGAPPDGGAYAFQYQNGPFPACNSTGAPATGNSTAFNGACYGYGPFGNGYFADQFERDSVINLHFGIPHKRDGGRDDIQLLWDNSMQLLQNASSVNDVGGIAMIDSFLTPYVPFSNPGSPAPGLCGYENFWNFGCANGPNPLPYFDTRIFAPGTAFGSNAAAATLVPYFFPSSPTSRTPNFRDSAGNPVFNSGIALNNRDGQLNDVNILKAQYTKNFGSNAYARVFGYTFYSDWLLNGPDCAATGYFDGLLNSGLCGNTADYELATHTRGAELVLADQINAQHLLQFTANYTTAGVTRFNNSTWEAGYAGSRSAISNLTNGDPNNPMCFSFTSGAERSCFSRTSYGTPFDVTRGQPFDPCAAGVLAPTTAACVNGAKWLVTVPGGQGTFNTVKPVFTSLALTDDFKPNDRLDLNVGLRYEDYRYDLANPNSNEFNFWFNAAAKVNCYDPVTQLPLLTPLAPGQPVPPSPVTTNPLQPCGVAPSGQEALHPVGNTALCDNVTTFDCGPLLYSAKSATRFDHGLLSPRIGATYTLNADTVLRATVGKYTQPTETAFEQYLDQSGKRAALFDFAQFWGLGFHNPGHDNPVQYSNNYDFSFEHRFHNSDTSLKISPFYRDTHNEIVSVVLGPNFVSGVNVGHQHSYGVEFQLSKGDPSRDGWAGMISYTYTKAQIQYGNLPNGTNAIDYLNNYVKAFNALTSAGGGSPCYNGGVGEACPAALTAADIVNPYFNMSPQGLLDRSAYYPTYPNEPPNDPTDQGGFGTAIWPHQFGGFVQYKHGKLAIAPNFQLQSGSNYGSPTDTYGIDPRACGQNQGAATDAAGNPVLPPGSPFAGNADFLTCGPSPFVQSGFLAIPNPYTGHFDSMDQFRQPWQLNIGALVRYEFSPKVTANLSLTNLVNTCYGGTTTPWQKAFKPNKYVCGYNNANSTFVGTQPGAGFFYGASATDPVNGGGNYAPSFNYPFKPAFGAIPFQAYFEVQIKL